MNPSDMICPVFWFLLIHFLYDGLVNLNYGIISRVHGRYPVTARGLHGVHSEWGDFLALIA